MTQYCYVDSDRLMTNKDILEMMEFTRKVVTEALRLRTEAKIKVRQPISAIAINAPLYFHDDFVDIIKDAVNVKKVIFVDSVEELKNIEGHWFTGKT